MATIVNYKGKNGKNGFRFFAQKDSDSPKQSMTWFPEDSWSARVVEREKMKSKPGRSYQRKRKEPKRSRKRTE